MNNQLKNKEIHFQVRLVLSLHSSKLRINKRSLMILKIKLRAFLTVWWKDREISRQLMII